MALTERSLDRMEQLAGDAFRRVGSLRLAVDEAERDALRARARRACARTASPSNGSTSSRRRSTGSTWARSITCRTGRFSPRAGCGGWPRTLPPPVRSSRAPCRCEPDELLADVVVVAGDGFTAGLLPELAGVVQATRGQVLATEPLPERLYERPHYAREGYDYWHQLPDGRLVIGGSRDASFETEQTAVEETTELVQDRLEALVEQLVGYRPAGDAPLGRHLGHDARPAAARRPCPGP